MEDTLDNGEMSEILKTEILSLNDTEMKDKIISLRRKRIKEAQSWEGGSSPSNPITHEVDTLPDGTKVFFEKPGKEVDREDPNPHDMSPQVGDLYEDYEFREIWAKMTKAALIDFEKYKLLLALIYRNAYLLDHKEIEGAIRYRPDEEVINCIDDIDDTLGEVLPGGVRGLLHFLDLLGWNEDVKYQSGDEFNMNKASGFYTGRINTILTAIDVSYKLESFIREVLSNSEQPLEIDVLQGLETAQNLTISGGISRPTKKSLEEWLSPTLKKQQ